MAASGSDYLGRCVPEACVVRGFERIHYAVLQVTQLGPASTQPQQQSSQTSPQQSPMESPQQPPPPQPSQSPRAELELGEQWQRLSRLRRARRMLIEQGVLAESLPDAAEIWVFAQSSESLDAALKLQDGVPTAAHLDGFALVDKSATDTSDLLNSADSTSSIPLPSTAQPYKAQPPTQAAHNAQKPNEKANKIYHVFIKAAESTLAFHLCEAHGYLPTPSGSLLQPPDLDDDDFLTLPVVKDARILTLSATLTRHGSLVLTWSCWDHSHLTYADQSVPLQQIHIFPLGGTCYTAPATVKPTFLGPARAAWRDIVLEYLQDDGVFLQDDYSDLGWASVQVAPDSETFLEWPEMLCYQHAGERQLNAPNLSFSDASTASSDHLEFALQLLWKHAEVNDKEHASTQDSNDEAADEIDFGLGGGMQIFSPTSIRQGPLHDFANTVYPTPPDVLHGGNMLDLVSNDETAFTQAEQLPLAVPTSAASARARSASFLHDGDVSMRGASLDLSNDDDLFGDGQDPLQDHDFEFFSKELSDEADITMEIDLAADTHAQASSNDVRQDDGHGPGSLLAVDSDATRRDLGEAQIIKPKSDPLLQAKSEFTQAPVSSTLPPAADVHMHDMRDMPPPLSITTSNASRLELHRKPNTFSPVLDTTPTEAPFSQTRQFNPVKFHQEINQSDSKYSSGGRFFGGQPPTPRTRSIATAPTFAQGNKGTTGSDSQTTSSSDGSEDSESDASDSDASFLSRARFGHAQAKSAPTTTQPKTGKMQLESNVAIVDIDMDVVMGDGEVNAGAGGDGDTSVDAAALHPLTPTSSSPHDQATIAGIILNAFQSSISGTAAATRICGSRSRSLPGSLTGAVSRELTTRVPPSPVPPEQLMELAQALFDQVAFSCTTTRAGSGDPAPSMANVDRRHSGTRQVLDAVEQVFRQASPVDDIDAFAIVDPTPILSSPRLQSLGTARPSTGQLETIFDIPAPAVEVSRNGSKWSLTPTGVAFWDTLGLAPANGPKDCIAHCIVPAHQQVRLAAEDFMQSMQVAYQSARFGQHQVGGLLNSYAAGIVELKVGPSGAQGCVTYDETQMAKQCRKFSHKLKTESTSAMPHVVYVADLGSKCPSQAALQAVLALQKTFDEAEAEHDARLVVKVVPWHLVASGESVVILDPGVTLGLCHEIYDRINTRQGPKDTNRLPIFTAPSMELEEPAVAKVPLQLLEASAVDPLMEGSCLHIAYARSADQRWITTVWTDSGGRCQTKAAYSLQGHSFPEIAIEIWATTLEMIRHRKFRWRLILPALEGTRKNEITAWLRFAERSRAWLSLTLVTCATDASLDALPPPMTPLDVLLAPGTTAGAAGYSTPQSTPKPTTSSPTGTSPAGPGMSTPAGFAMSTPMSDAAAVALPPDTDPSARLVDVADQAWGMVLSHRLNVCAAQPVFIPSLVSGFLAKRTGPSDYDAPTMLEVSLIYCADEIGPGESAMARDDKALREVLGLYRGLALLARLRGLQDERAVLPLHVLAAKRGAEALSGLGE